jgi:hypothetical protein
MNQNSMILPQFSDLQDIETKIKQERSQFESQRQKYEDYQRVMNDYRNKQK